MLQHWLAVSSFLLLVPSSSFRFSDFVVHFFVTFLSVFFFYLLLLFLAVARPGADVDDSLNFLSLISLFLLLML